MKQTTQSKKRGTVKSERDRLRKRVERFHLRFNKSDWEGCFALIDPRLQTKLEFPSYASLMKSFKDAYGVVKPWHIRVSLHLRPTAHQKDKSPFAFVYVVWQDQAHAFHMFRERWVKVDGKWFSRVVGLVPNSKTAPGLGRVHAGD